MKTQLARGEERQYKKKYVIANITVICSITDVIHTSGGGTSGGGTGDDYYKPGPNIDGNGWTNN